MLRSPRVSPTSACASPVKETDALASSSLRPRSVEQLQRIRGDLRLGLPVILQDERAAVLVALIESLTPDRFEAMRAIGRPELVVTRRRATVLGAKTSAHAEAQAIPLSRKIHLGDLTAMAGSGTTDATNMTKGTGPLLPGSPAQLAAIRLAKTSQLLPAVLSVPLTDELRSRDLMTITVRALNEALDEACLPQPVSSAPLPMAVSASGRVHVFRPDDGGVEHYAIEVGAPRPAEPITVRLHSACFTGDVLGSLKCDCGPQLHEAMKRMTTDGGGLLLYLNQEGRGIGLANKMRTYVLQDAGLDTVEANHWLGFEDDQRDFRVGAAILHRLNIRRVRLMTNNPAKVQILERHGIDVVERVSLCAGHTAHNAEYLATKALKSGHLL